MSTPYPQISNYSFVEVDPIYVIVFEDYVWEIAQVMSQFTEDGVEWYEVKSIDRGDDEGLWWSVCVDDCKRLPYLMTVGQYMDAFIKGNLK